MPLGNYPIQSKFFSNTFKKYEELSDLKQQQELDNTFEKSLKQINQSYKTTEDQFITIENAHPIVKSLNKTCKEFYNKFRDLKFELIHELDSLMRVEKLCDKLTSLIKFLNYFWHLVDVIKPYSQKLTAENIQRKQRILNIISAALKPNGDLTKNFIFVSKQRIEYPKHFVKYQIIDCALKTFVSAIFFMLEQYALIIEHYFRLGDVGRFNSSLGSLESCLEDLRLQLLGNTKTNKTGLIQIFRNLALDLEKLPELQSNTADFNLVARSLELLVYYEQILPQIELPFSLAQAEKLKYKPNFKDAPLRTPIGPWRERNKVSYTVQYENDGIYTILTPWTTPYCITKAANPKICVPHVAGQRRRLIYRQFEGPDCKPELVAILENEQQYSFRDISRDLFNAACNTNHELGFQEFKTYLKSGADMGAVFENGNTIWHAAAYGGNVSIAKSFLLNNKLLDINATNADKKTALDIAAECEHRNFVSVLERNDAVLSINSNRELHDAAYANQVLRAELLIEKYPIELRKYDPNCFTALHCGVFGGAAIVESLLQQPTCNFNGKTKANLTALHLAVLHDSIEVARVLLDCKAIEVDLICNAALRPLHLAVMTRNLEMTELLLSHEKIDVNATAINGWTALHIAVDKNYNLITKTILKCKDINVNAVLTRQLTPLHLAVVARSRRTIELLMENGADVNAQTTEGLTALQIAEKFDISEVLSALRKSNTKSEVKE